jgi:hypothetical protein
VEDAEFQSLYGRWQALAPREVRDLLAGSGVRWWIAGGVALDLAGAAPRPHEDIDVGVPFADLPALRAHLVGLHLWEAHDGALRPLLPGEELREGREQLWLRRDASQPWLADVLLTPTDEDLWLFKKDRRITLPLAEAVTETGGVPLLRPELVLLHKAHLLRTKDELDLDRTLPLLGDRARRWLDDALALYLPDHPWRVRLG